MSRLLRFVFVALLLAVVRPALASGASPAAPATFSWTSLPSAATSEPPPPPPPPPVSPRSGFEGVLATGPGTDVSIASGEGVLLIAAHGRIAIVSRGGNIRSEVNVRDFFGFANGTVTGTQCFFDPVARLWWVVGLWSPPGDLPQTLAIAHSLSPNPRSDWGLTNWPTATIVSRHVTEYGAEPIAAIAPGRFVVAMRHFVVATGRQDYESVLVFDRTVLDRYGYAPPVELRITAPPARGDRWDMTSTRPAVCLDRAGEEVLLVTSRAGGGSRVTLRRITGPPSAPVLSEGEFVDVAPYSTAPGARQLGTARRLETGDCRVRSAVVRDGVLSAAWHEAGRSGGNTASGIRVLQVRLRDRAVLTDHAFGEARTFAFAPALTADAYGALQLAYVRSAADEFPSAWTAVRRAGEPKFEKPAPVRTGEGASDSLDWSGPSGIALDPAPQLPGQTAWAASSFVRAGGSRGTWVQPVIVSYGEIRGTVLADCRADAASPGDRAPLAAHAVSLRAAGGTVIATAHTSGDGTFAFAGLEAGTYDVVVAPPAGGASVLAAPGSGGMRETAIGANAVRVVLAAWQRSSGNLFVCAEARPMPVLAALSPDFRWAGSAACTLRVIGSGFAPCASVRYGSLVREARWVSATELRVALSAEDLAVAGPRAVRVSNPEPGGGLSASVLFDVRRPDPYAPVVTLLAPVGGERWPLGATRRIAWSASDDRGIESVTLAYSRDGGLSFPHTIAAAIPDSGHFDWTLPDTGAAGLRVRVTVRDAFGNVAADSSQAAFAVPSWRILASATGPGRIAPSGAVKVADGDAPEFAMVADSNSYLARLRVNDVTVAPTTRYTFAPVHADQTIAADFGPRTYTWAFDSGTANFGSPGNWSPTRLSPATDDILQFANGGIVTATNVPSQAVGQLRVLNGTGVTLQTASAATLTLNGGGGHDLWIEAGSQLTLAAPSGAVTISLGPGATGRVDGLASFGTGAQRLVAQDAGALHFTRGSLCTISATTTGSVFGNGAGASALRSVVFDAGATLNVLGGGDPFGAAAPNAVLRMEHGSRYTYRVRGSSLDLSGRTLGDFEFLSGTSVTIAGTSPVTMDSLIVGAGTLWLNCATALAIRGDVTVKSGTSLTIGSGDFANPVRFSGDGPQRVTRYGTFSANASAKLTIDNRAGVTLGSDLAWGGDVTFAHGVLSTGTGVLDLAGTSVLTGAADTTGWIAGRVRRTIPGGISSRTFPVGTATAFAPLQLDFAQATFPFALTVSCADGPAPGLADAPVDTAHVLKRHWTLSSPTMPVVLDYTAKMTYVPGDLAAGTLASDLSPFQFSNLWYPRAGGATPGNTITAQHCTTFGVLTAAQSWYRDYGVTVTVDGPGTVTRSPDQATYAYGDIVTLTARPTAPATFVGWSGDTSATLTPLAIAVTRDRHLTATFRTPVTYVWKAGVSSGLWTDSLNWTPARREPAPNDILVFSHPGAVTVNGPRTETVAQLLVSGGAQVQLVSGNAVTLTLRGEGGHALVVEPGAKLAIGGTLPLVIALPAHARGAIGGRLQLSGAPHQLVARDTAAVTFTDGAVCEAAATGNVFGDGTGASGMRSVYFEAGSRFDHLSGGDPFGAAAPNAVVAFLPSSRYAVRSLGATVSLSGRTYADFEYDAPGASMLVPLESPVTMDSLLVRTGYLYLSQAAALTLRGDFTVLGGSQLGFYPLRSGGPVVMQGAVTQRIAVRGQLAGYATPPFEIDNAAGVRLATDVTWPGPLRFWRGLLHTGPYAFSLGTAYGVLNAGAGTGWVDGTLRVTVPGPGSSLTYPIGDSARYAPLVLNFRTSPSGFPVGASTTAGLHPQLGSAPMDTARSLRRWWRVSSPTATPVDLSYDAVMNFVPGELDSSTTPGQLLPLLYTSGWHYPTNGIATLSSVSATGLSAYGDLTAALPIGGPVEPRYVWTATSSRGAFNDAGNWTPPRLLRRADDILEFSRGTVDTAYGVPVQTIGQLVVSNGSRATLSGTGNATLSFTGRPGDDLAIASGATLRLTGTSGVNSLQLVLGDTTTARIAGTLELSGGPQRLLGVASDAIVFENGGACVLTAGFEGNPFGTGAAAGSIGSVRFASGSVLRQSIGGDPFGAQLNDAVLTFDRGSRYRIESNAFTPAFSRRTFADVELAVPSGLVDVTPTQPFTLDSLIVRQGVFNLTPSGGCTIRGDILVYRLATLNLAPRIGPSSVRIGGDAPQRLVGTGTFATGPYPVLVLDNPAGLDLGSNATWRGAVNFVRGPVRTGAFALTVDTATVVTASQATGWVHGTLKRTMRYGAPTVDFAVGTDSVYAPVTVTLVNNTFDFQLAVSTTDGDHPQLASANVDPARTVNRWWTLTSAGTANFATGSATFSFSPADLDTAITADVLSPFRYAGGWTRAVRGTGSATSVQATGLTAFGSFALAEPLAAGAAAAAALSPVAPGDDAPVAAFALGAPSPNPTRGAARIPFALPRASHVRVSVLDVQGREVAVLADGVFAAGRHGVTMESAGRPLAAGLYFVRLRVSGGPEFTRRIAIAR
ncbi:MAG: hypothetical protein HZA61_03670 [Candidatus Eisenbacteria bacterium]|uniref:Bacterial repeat domain-containing protein n=1 Tax=Eiseniibacteriota bacterium TaxID=2212470 RepID=A0A933W7L1_UNCEI|nr:hypothetical protein [Candidatus Eisenbacteria bacterium]